MTSVFYDVLSPRTLERAYRRPFLTVLGNLNPKMLSAIV